MTEEQPEIVSREAVRTAVVRGTVPMERLREFYDRAFREAAEATARQGVTPTAAFGLFRSPPGEHLELEVGFVVDLFEPDGEVVPSELPGGRAVRLVHMGGYDDLGSSWKRLTAWLGEHDLAPAGPMWEVYVTEPSPETDPATLRTDLFCPVR